MTRPRAAGFPTPLARSWICAALALAVLAGCGDDGDAAPLDARDSGPQQPAGGDGGLAGRCGAQACEPSALGTPSCCTRPGTGVRGDPLENTGRAPGLCGTDVTELLPALAGTCVQLNQPGTIDSECPAQEPLRGGVRMPGCCTDEGYCGAYETIIGFGCFYATGSKGRPCSPDTPDAGT